MPGHSEVIKETTLPKREPTKPSFLYKVPWWRRIISILLILAAIFFLGFCSSYMILSLLTSEPWHPSMMSQLSVLVSLALAGVWLGFLVDPVQYRRHAAYSAILVGLIMSYAVFPMMSNHPWPYSSWIWLPVVLLCWGYPLAGILLLCYPTPPSLPSPKRRSRSLHPPRSLPKHLRLQSKDTS